MTQIKAVAGGYQQRKVSLVDRFVDDARPLRLAIIGGGVAGILAGILLPAKVEHLELTIFEKNSDLVSCAAFHRRHLRNGMLMW